MDLSEAHQVRVARLAVGPSTARNQGVAGVVDAARGFLAAMDLSEFGLSNADGYRNVLDRTTERLKASLPIPADNWGLARKLLNIFIRDASYHVVLNDNYDLDRAHQFMELPLDSVTSEKLKKQLPPRTLPAWPGVKNLTEPLSDRFQEKALEVAAKKGIARVDLDVIWWGVRD